MNRVILISILAAIFYSETLYPQLVSLSLNNNYVAYLRENDSRLDIWDYDKKEVKIKIPGNGKYVGVLFSRKFNDHIYFVQNNGALFYFDLTNEKSIKGTTNIFGCVHMELSPCGTMLGIVFNKGKEVAVLDAETLKTIKVFQQHDEKLWYKCVSFSASGKYCVIADDENISVIEIADWKTIKSFGKKVSYMRRSHMNGSITPEKYKVKQYAWVAFHPKDDDLLAIALRSGKEERLLVKSLSIPYDILNAEFEDCKFLYHPGGNYVGALFGGAFLNIFKIHNMSATGIPLYTSTNVVKMDGDKDFGILKDFAFSYDGNHYVMDNGKTVRSVACKNFNQN